MLRCCVIQLWKLFSDQSHPPRGLSVFSTNNFVGEKNAFRLRRIPGTGGTAKKEKFSPT